MRHLGVMYRRGERGMRFLMDIKDEGSGMP